MLFISGSTVVSCSGLRIVNKMVISGCWHLATQMSSPNNPWFMGNLQATAWNYSAASDEEHCFKCKIGEVSTKTCLAETAPASYNMAFTNGSIPFGNFRMSHRISESIQYSKGLYPVLKIRYLRPMAFDLWPRSTMKCIKKNSQNHQIGAYVTLNLQKVTNSSALNFEPCSSHQGI